MDPTLLLASRSLHRDTKRAPGQSDLDAFYETHGGAFIVAFSRWISSLGDGPTAAGRGAVDRPIFGAGAPKA